MKIKIYKQKNIFSQKGNVLTFLKKGQNGYKGFGEIYFSTIKPKKIKGWKKHKVMHMNLFVPIGEVTFFLHDDSLELTESYKLGFNNYGKLSIPPGIWVAFRGESDNNIILNIASIEHDPNESQDKDISSFSLEESS